MDWTHALVALGSATLGAVAHKLYATWTRRSYWSNVQFALTQGKRRKHSMRKKAPVSRVRFRRLTSRALRDFDV